jgi:hypothetical protein
VNDQIVNPDTSVVEKAGSEGIKYEPPAVDVFIQNMMATDVNNPFEAWRCTVFAKVDNVVVEIGQHLKDELYELLSLNATQYSVVTVVMTEADKVDVVQRMLEMQVKLADAHFEKHRKVNDLVEKASQFFRALYIPDTGSNNRPPALQISMNGNSVVEFRSIVNCQGRSRLWGPPNHAVCCDSWATFASSSIFIRLSFPKNNLVDSLKSQLGIY